MMKADDRSSEVEIESFESITGAGVKASVKVLSTKYNIFVGNARLVTQRSDGQLPSSLTSFEQQESTLGRTVIYVSISSGASSRPVPVLAISLWDNPKASSAQAIRSLKAMGVEVCMMTGDNKPTALAIAKMVGIEASNVWANMSPQDKASVITKMMENGDGGIAMVGDGINDSPALVAASVGIALSSGTSVAIEAADIVLMRSDLLDVVAAIYLSRKIYSVIRRNLIWACIYNILGIPLAMGFFLPLGLYLHPMTSAAAMACSSVSVVCSSLTLKWWKRPKASIMTEGGDDMDVIEIERVSVWERISGVFGARKRGAAGYTQLPVEMSMNSAV